MTSTMPTLKMGNEARRDLGPTWEQGHRIKIHACKLLYLYRILPTEFFSVSHEPQFNSSSLSLLAASASTSNVSTRWGTSSSSPPVALSGRCWPCWIAWYDSASLRSEASESGPSWFRMPGTSSVSSFTWPEPYMANVLEDWAACTGRVANQSP